MKDEMVAAAFLAVTMLIAGDHNINLTFAGLLRSYIVHVPAGVSKSAPVVINLHGGGSNAEQHQRFSGTDDVADREHFIVVYPNGTGRERMRVWNAGTCCGGAPAKRIWPGRTIHLEHLLGRATHLIDANEEIWNFFKEGGAHR